MAFDYIFTIIEAIKRRTPLSAYALSLAYVSSLSRKEVKALPSFQSPPVCACIIT